LVFWALLFGLWGTLLWSYGHSFFVFRALFFGLLGRLLLWSYGHSS
jgi:hypothetical protein